MKYAIKGALIVGVIQLIFIILSKISLNFLSGPLGLLAITVYCICLLPTGLIIKFVGDVIKIPSNGNIVSLSEILKLRNEDWFVVTYSSLIFSTIILMSIGALIGFIYGKIKERNNIN